MEAFKPTDVESVGVSGWVESSPAPGESVNDCQKGEGVTQQGKVLAPEGR